MVVARADFGLDDVAVTRIADCYADRMAQLVTRIGEDLLAQVDELVADGVVESRSEAVRLALRGIVDAHRRRQIGDSVVAGYRAQPQGASEVGWADEATIAMIADESW